MSLFNFEFFNSRSIYIAMPEIVLVHPQIPQNAGNIARLSAATNSKLHFIKPLGFEISDKYLKRAGLDYWPEVRLTLHSSWKDFLDSRSDSVGKLWFFTTKASEIYTEASYQTNDFLIFGCETKGLPSQIHTQYPEQRLLIPLDNTNVRSLNLANSVAIALYEAKRQINGQSKLQ